MKQIKIFLAGKYLLIDEDNLPGLHSHETAMQLTNEEGKRLVTTEELEALAECKSRWGNNLKGMWFHIPTRKPFTGWLRVFNGLITRKVFFEAAGWCDYIDGSLGGAGTLGRYWSASPNSSTSGYALYLNFNSGFVGVNDVNCRAYGFSVRCVRDL
jgi:hypothetical protein